MDVALSHSKSQPEPFLWFDFGFVAFVEFALFSCFSLIPSLFHFSLWGRGFCPVCILTWRWECLGQCRNVHTPINTRAPLVCEAWMVHCTRYRLPADAEFSFSLSTPVQTAVSHLVFFLLAVCLSRNEQRASLLSDFRVWVVRRAYTETATRIGAASASQLWMTRCSAGWLLQLI